MTRRPLAVAMMALLCAMLATTSAQAKHRHHHRVYDASGNDATIIGHRPAGCPHAYCGCGLARYLGLSDVRLNLAWNWTRYYKGDRTIAVWHHHVALVEKMVGPKLALLRDYNSGGGLSRLHVRSIAGAVVVNRQMASR